MSKKHFFKTLLLVSLASIVILTTALFCFAIFYGPIKGEAYIGSFQTEDINENWILKDDNDSSVQTVTLPYLITEQQGNKAVLSQQLPNNIQDGMNLCVRASMQDIIVRIEGIERGSYTAAGFKHMSEKLPSAYLIVDINSDDAGKAIELDITSKRSGAGVYNSVSYGNGNNIWFPIIKQNILLVIISVFVILIGCGAMFVHILMRRKVSSSKALVYLSGMMIVDGMWILSESKIRQLIFKSPSYSSIFAYILVSIIAALTLLYLNEVQGGRYRKVFLILSGVIVGQVIINTVLSFTGIAEYYDTLVISHLWSAIAIVVTASTIVIDIRKKWIHRYSTIATGIIGFLVCAVVELLSFYFANTYQIGGYLGIGLIIMLISTLSQIFLDTISQQEKRRIEAEKQNEMTIRTITKAIDAKDEYTGGHSERVGEYARILCETVASKYGFGNDDFERIQYIGNLHDIGKIGVPDSILNKNGKLDTDEFELMKAHTVMGYNILENVDTVEGLKEGVRYHHERYDGKGYPDGLKGEDIPVVARILCIADSYDAMTSDRVYRKRLPFEKIREEFIRCTGAQFDPYLAEVFLKLIDDGTVPYNK